MNNIFTHTHTLQSIWDFLKSQSVRSVTGITALLTENMPWRGSVRSPTVVRHLDVRKQTAQHMEVQSCL